MGLLGNGLGWPHLLIILAIVLLLFGAPKLPGLAKSIGQSMRIFKGEMKSMKEDGSSPSENDPSATPQDDDAARSTSDDATSETTNTTHTKPPSNS